MAQNTILENWASLNAAMVEADEKACRKLLNEELAGKRRRMFIMRIHSRMNRVRADRERLELDRVLRGNKVEWHA